MIQPGEFHAHQSCGSAPTVSQSNIICAANEPDFYSWEPEAPDIVSVFVSVNVLLCLMYVSVAIFYVLYTVIHVIYEDTVCYMLYIDSVIC